MSKLFNVKKSEKTRILERHKSLNKKINTILESRLLLEDLSGRALLEKARNSQDCKIAYGGELRAKNGDYILYKVANYDSTNANSFKVGDKLYIRSVPVPNSSYVYYFDFYSETDKKLYRDRSWTCSAVKPEAPKPPKPQDLAGDCRAQRANAVKFGWLTWEQLVKTGVDTRTISQQYKQHNICNEMFYEFTPGGVGVDPTKTSAQSAELQNTFIKTFEDAGWVTPEMAPIERRSIMQKKTPEELDPNAAGIFPPGTFFYYDPERASKGIGSTAQTNYSAQMPTKDNCKNVIELFYDSWDNQAQYVPSQMVDLKTQVQRCKAVFHNKGKWGLLGGGKQLDYKLDVLSGMVAGKGPSRRDPYRLQ